MFILLVLSFIFLLSLGLAVRSMRDFGVPNEVKKLFRINKIRGTIMFFKQQIKHYKN